MWCGWKKNRPYSIVQAIVMIRNDCVFSLKKSFCDYSSTRRIFQYSNYKPMCISISKRNSIFKSRLQSPLFAVFVTTNEFVGRVNVFRIAWKLIKCWTEWSHSSKPLKMLQYISYPYSPKTTNIASTLLYKLKWRNKTQQL